MMALALAVAASACTDPPQAPAPGETAASSTADDTAGAGEAEDDGLVVVSTGEEPRVVLAATTALEEVVAVTATSSSSTTGDDDTQEVTADYDLAVVLDPDGETVLLSATPNLRATDVAGQPPQSLGSFQWALDAGGTILDMSAPGWDVPVQPQLRTLLSFSHLVLEVPDVAVGPGAEWYRETGGARVSVTVDDLDDEAVTGTVTVTASTDDGSLEVVSTGAWQRDTLVALDVVTTSAATATRDVIVDGEETELVVTQRDHRELVREGR